MTIRFIIILISITFTTLISAQSKTEENTFGIKFSGFVKTDIMLDSRQTVTAREGHFLLYPANENLDINGDDANAGFNLNMLSIQSRLKGTISGPDFQGAKTSGVIEGAFFGHLNSDINGFRLRHAFVKLAWTNTTLIVGQYWNPMFIPEVFPGTVSFNTGVPFQPFARNPQVRIVRKIGSLNLIAAASSQRDFSSTGPNGGSSEYLRNSGIPSLDFHVQQSSANLFYGAGINYKNLQPRLKTGQNYATDNMVSSYAAMAYFKYSQPDYYIKAEAIYGLNMYDQLMLGGYAVSSVDPVTDEWEFANYKTLSTWVDAQFGKEVKFGLFAGYTANQGAEENITGPVFSRGTNIDYIYRLSPRVVYQSGKVRFATELEYTVAAYGAADNADRGLVKDSKEVGNVRVLIGTYYFF